MIFFITTPMYSKSKYLNSFNLLHVECNNERGKYKLLKPHLHKPILFVSLRDKKDSPCLYKSQDTLFRLIRITSVCIYTLRCPL